MGTMEANRLELQTFLEALLGSRNVYFQPPNGTEMNYPAIVYERKDIRNMFADNKVYGQLLAYQVTVIDEDPDSVIVEKISQLPTARFDRPFASDNLNHSIFTLFF